MSVLMRTCKCCGKPVGPGKIWMTHLASHVKEGDEWAKKELASIEQLVAFRRRQREQTSGNSEVKAKPAEIIAVKVPNKQKFESKSRGEQVDHITKNMAFCIGRVYKNLSYHQADKLMSHWDNGPEDFEEYASKILREARKGLRSLKKLRKLNKARKIPQEV